MLQQARSPQTAAPQAEPPTILLVDDDRSGLLMLEAIVGALGYRVRTAENGAEAYTEVRENPQAIDVVVTDRMMPVLDGLALTRRLKREDATKHIPVVLLTGAVDPADIADGLAAGAFYYLTKPPVEALVASVLASALEEVNRRAKLRQGLQRHQAGFRNATAMKFRLRLPEEVDPVVSLLASMQENPDSAIQSIHELVQNAVEHGVLRFGFETKAKLLRDGNWQNAIAERAGDARYSNGWVEAASVRRDDGIYVSVKDNGPGFNWKSFIQADPSRASAPSGRGIARAANGVFDKLTYDETGNQVVGVIKTTPALEW
ncbi:response regulator [Acuticoccus sp. MNP-M23]|uniref:response regulator n=1 Tax=Acuticoccus sp. MNP-M23 TaxID=3072793 RepID=UPI0028157786|nr:response regulator [Acuticoccus sp. MNP-M23]WMS40964.1 response regulator [Acuticoccus sp. MNP-M23]